MQNLELKLYNSFTSLCDDREGWGDHEKHFLIDEIHDVYRGNLNVIVDGKRIDLQVRRGLIFYGGIWYGDFKVTGISEGVTHEEFDAEKIKLPDTSSGLNSPLVAEVCDLVYKAKDAIDGESMEHIIDLCNMREQMVKQLGVASSINRLKLIAEDVEKIQKLIDDKAIETADGTSINTMIENIRTVSDLNDDESDKWA